MKKLLIMRHGEAESLNIHQRDHDRHLSTKGIEQVKSVASQLIDLSEWHPQKIFCSPSQRTRETYESFFEETSFSAEISYLDQLYLGSWDTILDKIEELEDDLDCVLMIAHNPGLSDLVSNLSGEQVHLSTSDLVLLKSPQKKWLDASLTHDWSLFETLKSE